MQRLLPFALLLTACPIATPTPGQDGLIYPCSDHADCAGGYTCDEVYATCTSPPLLEQFFPRDIMPPDPPGEVEDEPEGDGPEPEGEPVLVFDYSWTRATGAPGWSFALFQLEQDRAPALVVFDNDGCSAAQVLLNGEAVLDPSDLNPNVTRVEREVLLELNNHVRARLASSPGCELSVYVIALVQP